MVIAAPGRYSKIFSGSERFWYHPQQYFGIFTKDNKSVPIKFSNISNELSSSILISAYHTGACHQFPCVNTHFYDINEYVYYCTLQQLDIYAMNLRLFTTIADVLYAPFVQLKCRCDTPSSADVVCHNRTGLCPSGSCGHLLYEKQSGNVRLDWSGLGCQTGNIAYGKVATQIGDVSSSQTADKAVDGTFDTVAHPYVSDATVRAWIRLDLLSLHTIYNVSLFNTMDVSHYGKLNNLVFSVANATTAASVMYVCNVYQGGMVGPGKRIDMDCPALAKYVQVTQDEAAFVLNEFEILEMIVTGEPFMGVSVDCERCSGSCDNVSCSNCSAPYLPPFCTQTCTTGTSLVCKISNR